MAVLKPVYGDDVTLTPTDTTLAASGWTSSPIYTNGTTGLLSTTATFFSDVMIGGEYALAATPLAGESVNFYVTAQHTQATATDMGGGIGANLTADHAESTFAEGTDFVTTNLILLAVVSVEAATPGDANTYHWGPVSVASAFGGVLPAQFMVIMENATAGALSATVINTYGVQYSSV